MSGQLTTAEALRPPALTLLDSRLEALTARLGCDLRVLAANAYCAERNEIIFDPRDRLRPLRELRDTLTRIESDFRRVRQLGPDPEWRWDLLDPYQPQSLRHLFARAGEQVGSHLEPEQYLRTVEQTFYRWSHGVCGTLLRCRLEGCTIHTLLRERLKQICHALIDHPW